MSCIRRRRSEKYRNRTPTEAKFVRPERKDEICKPYVAQACSTNRPHWLVRDESNEDAKLLAAYAHKLTANLQCKWKADDDLNFLAGDVSEQRQLRHCGAAMSHGSKQDTEAEKPQSPCRESTNLRTVSQYSAAGRNKRN